MTADQCVSYIDKIVDTGILPIRPARIIPPNDFLHKFDGMPDESEKLRWKHFWLEPSIETIVNQWPKDLATDVIFQRIPEEYEFAQQFLGRPYSKGIDLAWDRLQNKINSYFCD